MNQQQPPGYGPPPQGYGQPPQGFGQPPQGYGQGSPPQPPPKKGMSTLTIVLIVIGVVLVFGAGSCFVCAWMAGSAAKSAVEAMPMASALNAAQKAGPGTPVGIRECDDYIAKAMACFRSGDPSLQAARQQAIEAFRLMTSAGAASPLTRAQITKDCKKALAEFRAQDCK